MENTNTKLIHFSDKDDTIQFEFEVRYTSEDAKRIFGELYHEDYCGLLYCDKIFNKEYYCKVTKTFDFDNRKIILTIGNDN